MLNKNEILKKLKNNKKEIEKYGVLKIGLFGSFAKNQENRNSDIDIIVELKNDDSIYTNYCNIKYLLEDLFDRNIDLITTSHLKKSYKTKVGKEHQKKVQADILKSVIYV
ncbi:MAG: nucleotidyltransferase domain-containing protein [Cetobacterium sp.]|nr:nucleotidyltransferase domain-containing protein [Cetobacterium sp.]